MNQEEFTRQIEKHKAILEKHNSTSGFIIYVKLSLFLLIGISLCFMFSLGFPKILLIAGLAEGLALAGTYLYHINIRGRINHSNNIIAINRRCADRIQGELSGFTDVEAEILYFSHPNISGFISTSYESEILLMSTNDYATISNQAAANELFQPLDSEDELTRLREAIVMQDEIEDFSDYWAQYSIKNNAEASAQIPLDEQDDQGMFGTAKAVKFLLM